MKKGLALLIIIPLLAKSKDKLPISAQVRYNQLSVIKQDTLKDEQLKKGIRFEEGVTWPELLTQAITKHKYIFVDCYATWCRPCKYMADSIFIKKESGDYMNQHFINVKVQMNVTAKDNQEIKNWYNDANRMLDQYSITAFPTYLFLTPEGELIYKAVGTFTDAASFVDKASKALDVDEQYFFLLEQYNKGQHDPAFISRLIDAAKKSGDEKMVLKLKNN